jgi:hypothetical protein
MVRSRAPGTLISTLQINGTSENPSSRAELAGNAAFRSGLAVKIMEIRESDEISFFRKISKRSSFVAASIASAVLAVACVAPRIALTVVISEFYP